MANLVSYDGDYIVGGPPSLWVTPNFQLSEYRRPDGSVRIHREIVAAAQVLRSAYGDAIDIDSVSASGVYGADLDGTFLWLGAATDTLISVAQGLVDAGDLSRAERVGNRLYIQMPDPDAMPPIKAELAFQRAVTVTAGFETSGDPFVAVTGNFDGAGLSFGPIQVNFKSKTLPEVFKRFRSADEGLLRNLMGGKYDQWWQILGMPVARQIAWADSRSLGKKKEEFDPAWEKVLSAVGGDPAFRKVMLQYAYDVFGRKLIATLSFLRGLSSIRVTSFRCLTSLYDLCVQQNDLMKAEKEIRSRVLAENPKNELDLTRIAVEERGKKADAKWQADCISRRLTILKREPTSVVMQGITMCRDNPNLYLLRNSSVTGMEKYLL